MSERIPLVVIVGPTASGKTKLAIDLAIEFGGEIISADSRAVYKYLDIGTAKPTLAERRGVPHWGFDLVDPTQRFTVVDFKKYATNKISEIRRRGHVPILVGGTGLYVDAVLYDYRFPGDGDDIARRSKFDELSLDELYKYCYENNVTLPENNKNKRYVINNILRKGTNLERREEPIKHTVVVGISTEKQILRARIHERAQCIFSPQMVTEACSAASRFGWNNEAMTGNIYPIMRDLADKTISEQEAIEQFETADWRLAKRQLTWLRRNEHIHWLSIDDAYNYLARYLDELNKSC